MYKTILLAYNGSLEGQNALTETKELASWSGGHVWLVAVEPDYDAAAFAGSGYYDPAWDTAEKRRYQETLADGLQKLSDTGFKASGTILKGDPLKEISKFALGVSADLIVVGHHHLENRVSRWWSGSISSALVEEAPCSVFCVIDKKS